MRNIYVEDSVITPGGIQYNFYKSLRLDENELLDTASGPTWLGRFVFRESNGDEIYLNKYLDTIRIKTTASLNQSWTIGRDTTALKTFTATVSSLDTMTIDGILDSIKTINIQAYNGSSPISSIYNNYKIISSKAHGFYNIFDFYGFPVYENCVLIQNQSATHPYHDSMDIYPILPALHSRLDSSISKVPYRSIDAQFQYQPGNEWIIRTSGYHDNIDYDSIISAIQLTPTSIAVTAKRESISWGMVGSAPPQWQKFYTSGTYSDTIHSGRYGTSLATDSLERNGRHISIYNNTSSGNDSYVIKWKFLDSFCQNRILVRDTFSGSSLLSCYIKTSKSDYDGLNFGINYANEFIGCQQQGYRYKKLDYFNLDGCIYGAYYSLKPSSVFNYYKNNRFKLYPNPTLDNLYLETDENWNSLEVISLQGQTVMSFDKNHGSQFSLATLPSGLYIVKIKTDSGNYLQKILKE